MDYWPDHRNRVNYGMNTVARAGETLTPTR